MFHKFTQWFDRPPAKLAQDTPCDYPKCAEKGEYRAPKSREALEKAVPDDWHWFCLEHVRAYNAAWNYYEGMNEAQITKERQDDVLWQRPSWPIGEGARRPSFTDPFGFFEDHPQKKEVFPRSQEKEALETLGLSTPYSREQLKKAYHQLMKRYHPDRGGCVDKARKINEAYTYLNQHKF